VNVNLHLIKRVDDLQKRNHCWKVVIRRRNVSSHKYFSDKLFGNKAAALQAAIAYRDKLLQEISGADYSLWRRELKRPTNTSGIVGVARYVTPAEKNRAERPFWQAFWKDADGKRRSRSFSITLYGEDGARERACEARRKGLIGVAQALNSQLEKDRFIANAEEIRTKLPNSTVEGDAPR
jgi:hypothetical protein